MTEEEMDRVLSEELVRTLTWSKMVMTLSKFYMIIIYE